MKARAAGRPYRIAIVGAGPAGFYTAEALLRAGQDIAVDMFERLPTPFGLVRYGVAPDHPKLKQVVSVFDRIADLPGFRFFGNVRIGVGVPLDHLRQGYHAVILCCGAERDRPLGIPGASLPGVVGGMAFVGWYNGHPDRVDLAPDLSGRNAVVIGMGNVALDVARILAKRAEQLSGTDIADHALATLARSGIGKITVASRSGPAQARCTEKELREFTTLDACSVHADDGHYAERPATGVAALFDGMARDGGVAARSCHFAFGLRPLAILGDRRVGKVFFERAPIVNGEARAVLPGESEIVEIDADLVITCIGSSATLVPGLGLAETVHTIPHSGGRVVDGNGQGIAGLYAAGWIKRGASGTIGTNRQCAVETAAAVLADLPELPMPTLSTDDLAHRLAEYSGNIVSFERWREIDQREVAIGLLKGKSREKIIDFGDIFSWSE